MKTWVRRSLNVGVLSAGFLLVGGAAAQADDMQTGFNSGLSNGNQFSGVLQVPTDICGNSVAVVGTADASCGGGAAAFNESASVEGYTESDMTSGFNSGKLNGNQYSDNLQFPHNDCGNSLALIGATRASCVGGATAVKGGGYDYADWDYADDDVYGDLGPAGGYGAVAPAGGYGAVAPAGGYGAVAPAGGYGAVAPAGGYGEDGQEHGAGLSRGGMTTGYNGGVLNGNQIKGVLQAPHNYCGNSIAIIGTADASCVGGAAAFNESASVEGYTESDMTSGLNSGILNGNQYSDVIQIPINICGNSIALIGTAQASCAGGATAVNGGGYDYADWDYGDYGDVGPAGGYGGVAPAGGYGGAAPAGGYGGVAPAGGYGGAAPAGGYGGAAPAGGYAAPAAYAGGAAASDPAMGAGAAGAKGMGAHRMKASGKAKHSSERGRTRAAGRSGGNAATSVAHDPSGDGGMAATSAGYAAPAAYAGNAGGGYAAPAGYAAPTRYVRNMGTRYAGPRGHFRSVGGGFATGCDNDMVTGYNGGILNGNQIKAVLQAPHDFSGNAISIIGTSQARSIGGATAFNC